MGSGSAMPELNRSNPEGWHAPQGFARVRIVAGMLPALDRNPDGLAMVQALLDGRVSCVHLPTGHVCDLISIQLLLVGHTKIVFGDVLKGVTELAFDGLE